MTDYAKQTITPVSTIIKHAVIRQPQLAKRNTVHEYILKSKQNQIRYEFTRILK